MSLTKQRETAGPESVDRLRLTRKEAKTLEAAERKRAKNAQRGPSLAARVRAFLDESATRRTHRRGQRGFAGTGTGRVAWIESPVEYQGTTNQVCGLWPFLAGSGQPVVGTPLGRHLLNGSTVCADPLHWFLNGLVLNPSAFVLGRIGLGKSTLVRRMVTVLSAWGFVPMILSDTKPDYVDLIKAMDGQVIRMGRGLSNLNPLDLGASVDELAQIPDEQHRREALEEMRGRRLTLLVGLLTLVRGSALEAYEESMIAAALRILDREAGQPVIGDLTDLVTTRHEEIRAVALDHGDNAYYDQRVVGLLDVLHALGENGPFGDMFARPTTEHIALATPMVFDLSAIDDSDARTQAAVQSVCWNYGSAAVSAQKHLAKAGLADEQHHFMVMDELWRMLRASPLMVNFVDSLQRLNRTRGLGQALITHTMKDLKLGEEHLTEMAWGLVERSAMVFLGGLAEGEMGNLEEVFSLSNSEKRMITDWCSEGGVNPESGRVADPPGRGKFLLKIGKKPGIPFVTMLTSVEQHVNDTNQAWYHAQAAATGQTKESQGVDAA